MTLATQLAPPSLPAYGRLLLDVLKRNAALSIRGDEAEESWRVVAPVIDAWSRDLVALEEYAAGSGGPERGGKGQGAKGQGTRIKTRTKTG
jgi:glucose-6-phosphate 1-dehydrogenase